MMLKFAAAALWISLLTTGAILFSFQVQQPGEETADQAPAPRGLDYVRSGVISVPVLRRGQVEGYFLTRLVYTGDAQALAAITLPVDALLSDEVYSFLFSNPDLDFTRLDTVDLDDFRGGIRDSLNARLGNGPIQDILIEQMDFLRKNEVQTTTIRGSS